MLVSLSPVFMGAISWIFLRERVTGKGAAGLVLAFAGAVLVVSNGQAFWAQAGARVQGDLLILGTAVSWAVYSVVGKKLLGRYRVLTLTTWTTLIGTAFLLPFSAAELLRFDFGRLTWVNGLNLLYLGGAASVYGYLAWYRALARLPAVTVGSYLYFRPLLTGVLSALILHETIGPFLVVGGVLIIGGTWLASR